MSFQIALSEPRNYIYPQQQLISLGITTFIILSISLLYFFKSKKLNSRSIPGPFLIFMNALIGGLRNLCSDVMGEETGKKVAPYALYLFSYIFVGSLTPLIGFAPVFTSLGVPISMAFVTLAGTFAVGIKYQK
jgi:F-type H+-transporting ATPase subunit a